MDGSWPCNGRKEDGTPCSQILTADKMFCPQCGTPNKRKPAADCSSLCRACGNELSAGFKFCPSCGEPVGQTSPFHHSISMDHPYTTEHAVMFSRQTLPVMHDPERKVSDAVATNLKDPLVSLPEEERDHGGPNGPQHHHTHASLLSLQENATRPTGQQQWPPNPSVSYVTPQPEGSSLPTQQSLPGTSQPDQQFLANASLSNNQWHTNAQIGSHQQWPTNVSQPHQQWHQNAHLAIQQQWPMNASQLHNQRFMYAQLAGQQPWPTYTGPPRQPLATTTGPPRQPWPDAHLPYYQYWPPYINFPYQDHNATNLHTEQVRPTHEDLPSQQQNAMSPVTQQADGLSTPSEELGGTGPASGPEHATSPASGPQHVTSPSSALQDATRPLSGWQHAVSPPSQPQHAGSPPSRLHIATSPHSGPQHATSPPSGPHISTSPLSQPQHATDPLSGPQHATSPPSQPHIATSQPSGPHHATSPLSGQQHATSLPSGPQHVTSPLSGPQHATSPPSGPHIAASPPSGPQHVTSPPSGPHIAASPPSGPQHATSPPSGPHIAASPPSGPQHATSPPSGPHIAASPPSGPQHATSPPSGPHIAASPPSGPQHATSPPSGPHIAISQPSGPHHATSPLSGQQHATSLPSGPQHVTSPLSGPQHATSPPSGPHIAASPPSGPQHATSPPSGQQHVTSLPTGPNHATSPPSQPHHATSPLSGPHIAISQPSEPHHATSPLSGPHHATSPLSGQQHATSLTSGPQVSASPLSGPQHVTSPPCGPHIAASPPSGPQHATSPPSGQQHVTSLPSGPHHATSPPSGPHHATSPLSEPHHATSPLSGPHHATSPLSGPQHVTSPLSGPQHVTSPLSGPQHVTSPLSGPQHVTSPLSGPQHVTSPLSGPQHVTSPLSGPQHATSPPSQPQHATSPLSGWQHATDTPSQLADGPSLPSKPADGLIPHNQQSDGPRSSIQQADGPGLPSLPADGASPPSQQVDDASLPRQPADGPSSSGQQTDGASPPSQQTDCGSLRGPADGPSSFGQQADDASLPSQQADGATLPRQPADGPSPSSQQADGASPPTQPPDCGSLPREPADGISPPTQQADDGSLPRQSADDTSSSGQQADGASLLRRPADGASPPTQRADGGSLPGQPAGGPSSSGQQADGATLPRQLADGESSPSQPADGPSPPTQPPDGVGLPREPADGPSSSGQQADGATLPGQPADGPSPLSQQEDAAKKDSGVKAATDHVVHKQRPLPHVDILPSQQTDPSDDHDVPPPQDPNEGKFYNKNATEPDVFYEGKKNKPKQSGKGKKKGDVAILEFIIILDPNFKIDEKPGRVFITFGDYNLGDWNALPQHELLIPANPRPTEGRLMTVQVEIPVYLLRRNPPLEYKYCVIRDGSNDKKWENIANDEARKLIVKRESAVTEGPMQYYDGMVLRKPDEGLLKRTVKFFRGSQVFSDEKTTMSTVQDMLPSWGYEAQANMGLKSVLIGQTLFNLINTLFESMSNWTVCCGMRDDQRKACFKKALQKYIGTRVASFNDNPESREDASVQLASAMTAILLIQGYGLEFELPDRQLLMSALQVKPDEKQKKCHDFDDLVKLHFPGQQGILAHELRSFIDRQVSLYRDDCQWFKCIPLIHFLEGVSKPFEPPDLIYSAGHTTGNWWGLGNMADTTEAFKRSFNDRGTMCAMLNGLGPLFHVDFMFPRTILASLGHQNIKKIIDLGIFPPEALLAMIYYHIKMGNITPKNAIPKIGKLVGGLSHAAGGEMNGRGDPEALCDVVLQICVDTFDVMIAKDNSIECSRLVEVIKVAYSLFQKAGKREHLHDCEIKLMESLQGWLDKWLPSKMTKPKGSPGVLVKSQELDVWSELLGIDFGESTASWKENLIERLQSRLKMLRADDVLYMFQNHVKFDSHHKQLKDCIGEMAFEAAETYFRGGGEFLVLARSHHMVWRLFSDVLTRMWPKVGGKPTHDPQEVLEYILTLHDFKRFLQFFRNEEASKYVSDDYKECLMVAASILHGVVQGIVSGDILMSQLQHVVDNSKAFIENAEAAGAWKEAALNRDALKTLISWRGKELQSIQEYISKISTLRYLCGSIHSPVDVSDLDKKLKLVETDVKLSDACDCMKYDHETGQFDKDGPQVTLFSLSADMEKKLESFLKLEQSRVFLMVLNDAASACASAKAQDGKAIPLTLEQLFGQVWSMAESTWQDLSKSVVDGSVPLKIVKHMFKGYHENTERVEEELEYLFANGADPRRDQRLQQIQRYFRLAKYGDGAKEILEARDSLQLKGDFSMLETIRNLTVEDSAPLQSITEKLERTASTLRGMTAGQIHCIAVYRKSQPLVVWLKNHIKRLQELQTFVDLALMSATGKGDLEITKVTCLRATVSGFAPLIYDLKDTAGFEEFYAKCKDVWLACDTDQNLPQKLLDLHAELEWLKGVNDAQGDVEVNALKQVSAINSRGIYIISAGQNTSKTVEDVVLVRVPPEERNKVPERGRDKIYTLADLKELQSKLMLVAGKAEKGKEDVDSFVEKFDEITGLANSFVKICSAGNILFKTWTAKFYCDTSRKNNAVIDFSLSGSKLSGLNEDSNVTQQMRQIRQFIDSCLEEWQGYIEKERTKFPQLNHYTTEQLVILRGDLAQLAKGQDGNTDKVVALLKDVHPDCNMKHIQTAFRETEKEQIPENDDENGPGNLAGALDEEDAERLKELVNFYGQAHVNKAIENVGDGNIDKIDLECMELENKDDETNEEDIDIGGLQIKESMEEMTRKFLQQLNEEKSNLREKLDNLWKKVHTNSAKSMADYLSIVHLGGILQHLSDKAPINRPLPTYLQQGQPNLIVCPVSDILSTVVSVYMVAENLPLPTRNEVLLCNEYTSSEEVELLVRRAVSDCTGRIFMLVSVQLLNYEVAAHLEKSIERYTQGHANYKLAIICSSELQDRSQLVTTLDNYRVRTPARPPLECLKAYLQAHLKGNQGIALTASQVDPENCCVRVVRSKRSGTGKTLWMKRKRDRLLKKFPPQRAVRRCHTMSLPLYGKSANVNRVLEMLLPHTQSHNHHLPSLYHFNIPHEMQDGVDHLLFNLIILGSLVDPLGYAWRRSCKDFYVIEIMPLLCWEVGANDTYEKGQQSVHHCLEMLPTVMCCSPQESLEMMQREEESNDQLMDLEEFRSIHFQRVFQFLSRLHSNADLRRVNPKIIGGTQPECLKTLLRYCGLQDPSWAELIHFIRFLDIQLVSCTESSFCSVGATSDDALPGFLRFVVRFMIQMSRDFSTRSLNMTDETNNGAIGAAGLPQLKGVDEELVQFQLKRRWETSPHPYIFFNPDGATMTFMGFVIKKPNFDVVDPRTGEVLDEKIMNKQLFDGLLRNGVNLAEDFDALPRLDKINKLCMVMGNDIPHDPDDKYVLTSDNVKKILAIQMRFRCNIPVVIMGETGCGKTELIKFMCRLQCPKDKNIKNMLLMKVHGGTTEKALVKKIKEGQKVADFNEKNHPGIHTVLFLDEVNTTEALGLVKEVLCDHMLNGASMTTGQSLRLIAACNPYRKHPEEVIKKLEQAGLGYHVKADQTTDKLGRIPMRRLVYRVQPLPQSLLPLVWDFGQLPHNIEKLYIRQIVGKKLATKVFEGVARATADAITDVLVAAQNFMRNQQDECSFVSLRDVNRAMDVMAWFYHQRDTLFPMMDNQKIQQMKPAQMGLLRKDQQKGNEQVRAERAVQGCGHRPSAVARSLILALGVCYHACLQEKREGFRMHVCEQFKGDLNLAMGHSTIKQEISLCQDVFLNEIKLEEHIARNQALKENLFMMVVCIELRIPLFLVGKPGSSKSLAKTIVMDAMQGPYSRSELFKKLKQVCMVSYQCSPLSTPDGIISTFRQCAQLQSNQDLDKFVAVVVLDEIGLAEDSPQMPLKTLHPLLEDGCATDGEKEELHKKVGFIGISNWALDPAKMNRGILVQRGPPDVMELEQTAKDICSSDEAISHHINRLMRPLAEAYTDLYNKAFEIREFYGLRDFYSLVKMVNGFAKKNKRIPTWHQLKHAILRNFGGLDSMQPVEVFCRRLERMIDRVPQPVEGDPDNTPAGLIKSSLGGGALEGESRYLLVLTENYAALQILQEDFDAMRNAIIIFGSSFPKDQDYVVVCRNINRIKICMETGQTVILLNLESLYESLYDALNQYYTYFGGQRHVDLGLGSHRVKSRVHPDFRLIVVAEKEVVYKKFPIPLINRLEKHFVAKSTILTGQQQRIVKRLCDWTVSLATIQRPRTAGRRSAQLKASDIFIGYHHDTCATVVLQVCHQLGHEGDEAWHEEVFRLSKEALLQCATPEAIIRTRKSRLSAEEEDLTNIYFRKQQHESLSDYLKEHLNDNGRDPAFIQVTTHSRLLSNKDVADVARVVGLPPTAVHSQVLHAFNTEQQFYNLLREYFKMESVTDQVLIIQCDSGDKSGDLIACIRYMIREEFNHVQQNQEDQRLQTKRHIVIIIQLPRVTGGCFIGFQGGMWKCLHLDDLRAQYNQMPPVIALKNQPVSMLVRTAIETRFRRNNERVEVDMDVDPMPVDANIGDRVDDHLPIANHKQTYSHQLLRSCVHGAVGMLNDRANMANNTARIHILLSLLQEKSQAMENDDQQLRFVDVLEERVYLLLKDKEDTQMGGTMASDWLINEVASVDAINNAGTFRHSLWDCLEKKMTPIMAGLIAYADTNDNLVLVTKDKWRQHMWVRAFREQQLTPTTYHEIVSATRKNELQKIPVQMKGYDGTPMSGRLPFSWTLKSYVDTVIVQKEREKVGEKDVSRLVGRVLRQSPWWPVLGAMFKETDIDTIKDCYLDDFVRMVYKPRTENATHEYELIKRSLDTTLCHLDKMEKDPVEQLGVEHLIPMVHVANTQIQSRIQLFADVLTQHPDILREVHELLNHQDNDPLSSPAEMALDVLAVRSLVRYIQPNRELLRDPGQSRAWLHQVEMTSPLVDTILARATNLHARGLGSYSDECMRALDKIWCEWNRVSTVKLFIEMVCPAGSDQERQATMLGPLFFKKLEGANFKTVKTMRIVEDFLQLVTERIQNSYFGKTKECSNCKEKMVESVVLPCKHEVCEGCLKDLQDGGDFSCFVCKHKYEEGQKLKRLYDREQVQKFQAFKQRCNAFLTELVSRMCFAGDTPPEEDVITMLMGYITKQPLAKENQRPHRTKAMNLFNDNLDPTPIIRSVLLQLLLRSSFDRVSDYLDIYLREAQQHVKEDKDIVELAVLYIQCLEDHYHNIAATGTERERNAFAIEQLMLSVPDLKSEHVTRLSGIAKARFGLSVVSEWMIKVCVKKIILPHPAIIDELLQAGCNVCTQETHPGPSLFLMRQIARRYSLDELHQVAATFKWVIPDYAQPDETETAPDPFVVLGPSYTSIRNAMNKSLMEDTMGPLTAAIKGAGVDKRQQCVSILLAVFREITAKHVLKDPQKRPPPKAIERIQEACRTIPALREQRDLLQALSQNALATRCPHLKVSPDTSNQDMALIEVILHFTEAMTTTGADKLLEPIINLIRTPSKMQKSYLPTMPEDKRIELKDLLAKYENIPMLAPTLYECPKGHAYMIGNCGRPVQKSKCPECGAAIGGAGYNKAQEGNKPVEDTTRKGHSLGAPDLRSPVAGLERAMTPACTTMVRLLLHLALYVGANKRLQEVHPLITPPIQQVDVPDFLWRHLKTDLDHISRATGKGMDDTLLLIHLFIQHIMLNAGDNNFKDPVLTTKEARRKWETEFAKQFVTLFLQNLDERLRIANNAITQDDRQSNNSLRHYLHESGERGAKIDVVKHLDHAPAIWRYRTRVSIEHLTQELGENMAAHGEQNLQQYKVLHLFLKKEPLLRVVRLIPDILRFITILTERYHRRIDRAEADELTIRHFFEKDNRHGEPMEETKNLFNTLATAWDAVHTNLQDHVVLGGHVLPEEHCNQKITWDTPLSTFLPSDRGRGLCTVALLHYLTSVHNEFIDNYHSITRTSARPDVSFLHLTRAHIISYDPDRELLPMVLANCSYSLEVGHGTHIEYNYRSLEQQLMERFIKGKAPIAFHLQYISYREELNNAALFNTLKMKIPQEPLSPAVRDKIRGDCQNMMEITDCLSSLDIAIGFLVSVGGEPGSSLSDFMIKTLQMDAGALMNMTRHHCKLSHSQALWLLLSHEREKMAARHKHELFTSVDASGYHVELSKKEKEDLRQALTHVDVDRFLSELHECIILHLTIKQDPNDEDYVDNKHHPLADVLMLYIEDKDGMPIQALTNGDGDFLKDIKAEKCVEVWSEAFAYHEANIGEGKLY